MTATARPLHQAQLFLCLLHPLLSFLLIREYWHQLKRKLVFSALVDLLMELPTPAPPLLSLQIEACVGQ